MFSFLSQQCFCNAKLSTYIGKWVKKHCAYKVGNSQCLKTIKKKYPFCGRFLLHTTFAYIFDRTPIGYKVKEISLVRNFLNKLQTAKLYLSRLCTQKYCILTRWGDRIAKCRSQVKDTIKRTDAHIATCPNASMIPRTVLNESEIETAKSKRESFEKNASIFV